jgi:hemolysin activation/secretion protein
MKLITVIGTTILSLSLTGAVYAQEQHDQQDEQKDKSAQEEKKAQPEKQTKPEEKNAQQEKHARPEEKNAPEHAQAKPANQNEHATAGRIPADRYKANFGREHTFRVSQGDYQNHRFQYGGYWFGFGSPWPSNWLYTQDVYVVEIGGMYYLCNPAYPGVNVTLNVTL